MTSLGLSVLYHSVGNKTGCGGNMLWQTEMAVAMMNVVEERDREIHDNV